MKRQEAIEHSSLDIKLKRVDRIYLPGEMMEGLVIISSKAGWSHQGIMMHVAGHAKLQLSARSVGLFESMSNIKPLCLMDQNFDILDSGKVPDGVTEIPFEFQLPKEGLHESYHGVYINVEYKINVSCERGFPKKALHRNIEFVVEVPEAAKSETEPERFEITPESLENVNASSLSKIPIFKISGRLFHKLCPINLPFTGEVTIEASQAPVKSIELQLVRVETVKQMGKTVREATEIQNIQIGDGDVCRNLVMPLYMIFPRLFTCPTMLTDSFQVEFEVNLIVVFGDGYMVTENFPIELYRGR
eukprot:CAMPEP_0185762144 /NCGR_PEP_ID=MMETSP1174-20130828/21106_1 /TAXON_ID=35687 /ORGANISM="Dictyocha speculum, Strain CCMP1381" /LENGTH=302 /DNA_ID=CAMNT_0028443677 /DNA_START=10 /DNA_END=918 /DNA_ORIENTATION=-